MYSFTVGVNPTIYGPYQFKGISDYSNQLLNFSRYGDKIYKVVTRGETSKIKPDLDPIKQTIVVSVVKSTINIL